MRPYSVIAPNVGCTSAPTIRLIEDWVKVITTICARPSQTSSRRIPILVSKKSFV